MAAEVSSIMRLMKDDSVVEGGDSRVGLVTMDLLGGYYTLDSKELDLDLQLPFGYESHLDMKRMLEESPALVDKRSRLKRSIKLLKESKDVVSNIMDKVASYGE